MCDSNEKVNRKVFPVRPDVGISIKGSHASSGTMFKELNKYVLKECKKILLLMLNRKETEAKKQNELRRPNKNSRTKRKIYSKFHG